MAATKTMLLGLSFLLLSFSTVPKTGAISNTTTNLFAPVYVNMLAYSQINLTVSYQLGIGPNRSPLLLDLGGEYVWYICPNLNDASFLGCTTTPCYQAKGDSIRSCPVVCDPRRPNLCTVYPRNPYSLDCISSPGKLIYNDLNLKNTDGPFPYPVTVQYPYACVSSSNQLQEPGVAGLGRTHLGLSIPTQLNLQSKLIKKKFTLCLPGLYTPQEIFPHGWVIFGDWPRLPSIQSQVGSSSTPLATYPDQPHEYFLPLKRFTMGGSDIDVTGHRVRLSTTSAYTMLPSKIYKKFVLAFKTETLKLYKVYKTKFGKLPDSPFVSGSGPFSVCMTLPWVTITSTDKDAWPIPKVDFVMENGVKWSLNPLNVMKQVSQSMGCLTFLDGGVYGFGNTIVVGTYQFQDTLLTFDLEDDKKMSVTYSYFNFIVGPGCESLVDDMAY